MSWHLFLFLFNARAPAQCHFLGGNAVSHFVGKISMYFYKSVIDEHQNMLFVFRPSKFTMVFSQQTQSISWLTVNPCLLMAISEADNMSEFQLYIFHYGGQKWSLWLQLHLFFHNAYSKMSKSTGNVRGSLEEDPSYPAFLLSVVGYKGLSEVARVLWSSHVSAVVAKTYLNKLSYLLKRIYLKGTWSYSQHW